MKIHSYYSSNGTDLIDKYINGLTRDEQVDAHDVLLQLENGNMDVLTIKRWEGKVQEVYFYKHNRIFYVVVDKDNIYCMHVENRRIKLRKKMQILLELEQKN